MYSVGMKTALINLGQVPFQVGLYEDPEELERTRLHFLS